MRLLFVTWAWPPVARIGALRPMGLARELVRAGHEVHILTGPGDRGGEYTPDLEGAAAASGAIVHRADAPGIARPPGREAAYQTRTTPSPRHISRVRQIVGQWKAFPDLQRSWIGPASRMAVDLNEQMGFDLVWSTSPPESSHFVARALSAGVPWIADFRDQWSEYLLARWDPVSRWVIDRVTRWTLSRAASITANAEGVARSIGRASGREVSCVRNGFDPIESSDEAVRERTLGYFGRVDPNMQHPERLWPALRLLCSQGRAWRVDLHAAPGGGGGARVEVPADLQSSVSVLPPLPHPEALRKMQSMTALLVLAWEVRGGEDVVAGKLYEYVGSGRPVLVCAPAHFEARALVEETGTGVGGWDTNELVEALERCETFEPSAVGRASLTRDRAAQQLLAIIERLVGTARLG